MKYRVILARLGFAVVLLAALNLQLSTTSAHAQQYAIPWFKIAGGGGLQSTGGVYAVSGTIGQPDASGTLTNGPYSVTGGFWPGVNLVQTPGAPLISVERSNSTVRVFWPLPAAGYMLEVSLTVTGVWSQVNFPYATNATDISISVTPPMEKSFYRLRKP